MKEEIILTTSDNIKIVGDYYTGSDEDAPAVIFLHMMPADKSSWEDFASKLQQVGYQSLAIDLRGHGESVEKDGEIINYKNFSDEEHQQSRLDVDAAIDFFNNRGIANNQIAVVGASIGSNLALDLAARKTEIPAAVLLSPGLDYRGLLTLPMVQELKNNQAIFISASENDKYSAESGQQLYDKITIYNKKIKIYQADSEHGTDIFKKHPELMDELIAWLQNNLK